jgi:hypothetical protein
MRRIRHHVPTAKIIAAFWDFDKDTNGGIQSIGVEIATDLKEALKVIRAAMPKDSSLLGLSRDRQTEQQDQPGHEPDDRNDLFSLAGLVQTLQ